MVLRHNTFFSLAACLLLAFATHAVADGGSERVRFNRDVRPILSDTCFKCHGFDKAARKADLRLDIRAEAIVPRHGDNHQVPIVPGDPRNSAIWQRIITDDPGDLMPPQDSHLVLTPSQKETIRLWIAQGAEYEGHWAFILPARPAVPEVKQASWARNSIDRFVLQRLEHERLHPSPEAEKETLIRRATLDLTGLPPTPAEVDAFLADQSTDAYEKLIDRLLASPHYGERLAAAWLDAARYADTSGYQADWERHMWPWRDWVVRAFNANMPFDQFTVEQLAGDMLPGATIDQRLATGFNRNHRINDEGGIIPEEYAVEYVVDRVETTAAVWLGLTAGCARCHDHKYDPLSQKEFYRLYAYFNNVPENGMDGRAGYATPYMRLPAREMIPAVEKLKRDTEALAKQLEIETPESVQHRAHWERETLAALGTRGADPWRTGKLESATGKGVRLYPQPDGSVVPMNILEDDTNYDITLQNDALDRVTAIRLEAMTDPSLPNGQVGPGDGNFLLSEVEVSVVVAADSNAAKPAPIKIRTAFADYEQDKYPIANAIDGKPRTHWAVDGDVLRGQRTAVFAFDKPVEAAKGAKFVVRLKQGTKRAARQVIGRARVMFTDRDETAMTPVDALPGDVEAALRVEPAKRSAAQAELVAREFRRLDPDRAALTKQLVATRRKETGITADGTPVMVMQEMATPRDTHLLKRGQYDQPDTSERLAPGVPDAIPVAGMPAPKNRLELARWLVDPGNPLTARVTVNRVWQSLFGTGIVKTSEDFGAQGEWPSHPELLDWLATEFVRPSTSSGQGWDLKALHRLIVTSATYRQSSRVTPARRERDPENRLLARGSRYRLDSHAVRDNALAVGGLLVDQLGGPPVKPYQPPGLWEELSFKKKTTIDEYVQDHGDKLYRRTLYSFWKRTAPPPALAIFDAAGREACTVRLGRTNTPLQALNLLNDIVYVEAARKLGERMMREGGSTPTDRLTYGFRLATSRRPDARELASLLKGFEQYTGRFRADPAAAKELLGVGESPADKSLDPGELAAYTASANVLLNLDETLTKE
jgi:hypothetical protein